MDSIIQLIASQIDSKAIGSVSEELGVDEQHLQKAVGMALPLLLGALDRNASSSDGAEALSAALDRDHDGSIFNDLPAAVKSPKTRKDGAAILGHVLGDTSGDVMNSVGRATKIDTQHVASIFATVAPVVLGAVGQMKREKNLDAQGVSSMLHEERKTVEGASSALTQLLDMDGDGDVSDEVISLGSSLLGGLLSGNK